jgi:predicted CoA-binding protein
MNVAVLGASPKPERYSHQAVALLQAKGHTVFPVNPGSAEILGLKVYARLADIPATLDTVTVYLSPERTAALADEIAAARPGRVIFNPGAENPELAAALREHGIEVVEACTLVLLRTEQF